MKKFLIIIFVICIIVISVWGFMHLNNKNYNDLESINNQEVSQNTDILNNTEKDLTFDLPQISVLGKKYSAGNLNLDALVDAGFFLRKQGNSGYYINETKNLMSRLESINGTMDEGYVQITKDNYKDISFILKPGVNEYNQLEYYLVNDSYPVMDIDLGTNIELQIQNWNSKNDKDYKECMIASISFGANTSLLYNSTLSEKDKSLLENIKNQYPEIKIDDIGLGDSKEDLENSFSKNRYSYKNSEIDGEEGSENMCISVYDDYSIADFYFYNGKIININFGYTTTFWK